MSKKSKTKDWPRQHHDGVSEKTMIGRPVKHQGDLLGVEVPMIDQVHDLEVHAWLDGKLVGHVEEKQHAHYPDDGIPYVYDGRATIVKALRGMADRIEAGPDGI